MLLVSEDESDSSLVAAYIFLILSFVENTFHIPDTPTTRPALSSFSFLLITITMS